MSIEVKLNLKEGDSVIAKKDFEIFGDIVAHVGEIFEVEEVAYDHINIGTEDVLIDIDYKLFSEYFEEVEEIEEDVDFTKAVYSTSAHLPNKVTEEMVDKILKDADIAVDTLFDRCTVVTCKLPCGFVITETSACVDPANYNVDTGINICIDKIVDKVYELEAYRLMNDIHNAKKIDVWLNCEEVDECEDCPYVNECFEEEEEEINEVDECADCDGKYVCEDSPYKKW